MKSIQSYKLFRAIKGKLYPLFVNSNQALELNQWLFADTGNAININGVLKVKSRLGNLTYRPGWHSSNFPIAIHIGKKENGKIKYRRYNEVWAEIEVSAEINYQHLANNNGINHKGIFNAKNACLSYIPSYGYYRYKTNPNMLGDWLISGAIRINKVLDESKVNSILIENNIEPMEWENGKLDLNKLGF